MLVGGGGVGKEMSGRRNYPKADHVLLKGYKVGGKFPKELCKLTSLHNISGVLCALVIKCDVRAGVSHKYLLLL